MVFTETTDGTFSKVGCPAWSPRGGKYLIFTREVWASDPNDPNEEILVVSGIFRTLSNGTGAVVKISGRRANNVDWQPIAS